MTAGALGQNMVGGIQVALDEYNAERRLPGRTTKQIDSQGGPDKAPRLATQIVNEDRSSASSAPAFSGESLAAGQMFVDAGVPSITPSATNVTIRQQGWNTFHRVSATTPPRARRPRRTSRARSARKKVFVIDDGQEYGEGLAGITSKPTPWVDTGLLDQGHHPRPVRPTSPRR